MYGGVPSLLTLNYHTIVNHYTPRQNEKFKVKKRKG